MKTVLIILVFICLSFSAANSGTQTPKSVIVDKRYGLEDAEEFIKKQIRKGYITKTVSINHIGEVLVVMEKY